MSARVETLQQGRTREGVFAGGPQLLVGGRRQDNMIVRVL